MTKQKIGFLGGTFNPPHMGHLIMAQWVQEALGLDKVYFLPSADPPHQDEKKTIPGFYRKAMTQLALSGHPSFQLEPFEVDQEGKHYTFDTMTSLKDKYKDQELYFIIGGDMVDYLPTWHRIDELCQLVQLVGVYRSGALMDTPYPVLMVEAPTIDISSSLIRQRVKEGKDISLLVPQGLADYIRKEGLYASSESK